MILALILAAGLVYLALGPRAPLWVQGALLGVAIAGPLIALIRMAGQPNLLLPAPRGWAALAALAVIAGFVAAIRTLRARRVAEAPAAPDAADAPFSDAELDRYARHIVLREIGGAGQRRLKQARVLVVGAGGLGAPALLYLAAAGVGRLGVIDDDRVSNSNLQRQVIHQDASIGMEKVHSAAATLRALNPFIEVRPYARAFTAEIAADLVAEYDLVLDGSDNFATRHAVNAACVAAGVPLISGALSQWEGQLSLFDPARGAPCYRCLFPEVPAEGLAPSCAEGGVLGPLPGIIGAMMAAEAVKALTGAGQTLAGRLMIHDALYAETRIITIARDPACPCCGSGRAAQAAIG